MPVKLDTGADQKLPAWLSSFVASVNALTEVKMRWIASLVSCGSASYCFLRSATSSGLIPSTLYIGSPSFSPMPAFLLASLNVRLLGE